MSETVSTTRGSIAFEATPSHRGNARWFGWLFILAFAVFAASSTGGLSVDPADRWVVAETFVKTGSFEVDRSVVSGVDYDGKYYSVFFPGQSLVFLPLTVLTAAAGAVTHVDPKILSYGGQFIAATFVIPLCAAIAVVAMVKSAMLLGLRYRDAVIAALLLLFATPFRIYAGNGSEEPLLAMALMVAIWAALDIARLTKDAPDVAAERAVINRYGLIAVCMAFGIIHRGTFIAGAAAVAVLLLSTLRPLLPLLPRHMLRAIVWLAAAVLLFSVLPLYNYARFGSFLKTGYDEFYVPLGGIYTTPLLKGLVGHLFSPGKSLFLYTPLFVLFPFALMYPGRWALRARMTACVLVAILLHLYLYSRFTYWGGDAGWGVRFNVSLMPLAVLAMAPALAVWIHSGRIARSIVATVVVVSAIVQVAGGALQWTIEWNQYSDRDYVGIGHKIPGAAAWTWDRSPLRLRFVNIAAKLRGERLIEGDDPKSDVRNAWNLFPLRGAAMLRSRMAASALWALWLAFVAMAAWSFMRLWRQTRTGEMT